MHSVISEWYVNLIYWQHVSIMIPEYLYKKITCLQEGNLKKINKDRYAKTTKNIQEGLPFDYHPELVAAICDSILS